MRFYEWGRIVKGVNTTPDVSTNEIPRQAAKFGNTVDKDGRPPTLSKKVKGKSTNVLFNLGLAEGAEITMWTNPKYQGADVDDKYYEKQPVKIVDVSKLTPFEPADKMDPKDNHDNMMKFVDKIKAGKKIKPIVIVPYKGKGLIVDGHHRYFAHIKAGVDKIRAVIADPKDLTWRDDVPESITEAQELSSVSTIYVDMDGVLADFFGAWAKLMGASHWTKIEDVPAALEKIKKTEDFWLNLPLTNNAQNLLSLIKDIKGEYVICSSPLPGDPNSEPHKLEWIKKNLSFFPPKDIIITHDKPRYATTEDGTPNILIDDYGKNIQAWESAGGIGFKHKDHKFERTAKAIQQHMQEPVEENFADGKKKGKSRPGRVKRAGASCNGSVTDLRKRAKNASGEKAKMYHWCANMKSGKKKGK